MIISTSTSMGQFIVAPLAYINAKKNYNRYLLYIMLDQVNCAGNKMYNNNLQTVTFL